MAKQTTKTPHYGLLLEPIQPNKDYVFGGYTKIAGVPLQENGQWDPFLPVTELQHYNGFDTSACVTFATLTCVEILHKRIYGFERNFSDRFLAKVSGTTAYGNTPQQVGESLRKKGVVNEEDWSFNSSIDTFVKFYSEIPDRLFTLAALFLTEFDFYHEYVVPQPQYLKDALKYSPLLISVYAWVEDPKRPGIYYKPAGAQDNHATVCYGYEDNQYWKIFDTYDSTFKKVAWDALPLQAKRFALERHVVSEPWYKRFVASILNLVFQRNDPLPEVPAASIVPEPTPETPAERLHQTALHYIGTDASPNDIAPDELGCAESVSEIVHEAFNDFPAQILSTAKLYKLLGAHPAFKKVKEPLPGDIIISPTGYATKKTISNGHTGIVTDNACILSNDSRTGTFQNNYTIAKWSSYYGTKGGYPIYYFRRISA